MIAIVQPPRANPQRRSTDGSRRAGECVSLDRSLLRNVSRWCYEGQPTTLQWCLSAASGCRARRVNAN